VIEAQGVLMRDGIDLVVGYVVVLAGSQEFFRRTEPFGVGMRKIELPTDVLDPDVVSVLDPDRVRDEACDEMRPLPYTSRSFVASGPSVT
jgi:hypothetical protein